MVRDIVKEFNLDLSKYENDTSSKFITNKEALENIKTVENVDLSWQEKIRKKIEKDFSDFVHKWQNPMSWVDLALTANPTGAGAYYKYQKIKNQLEGEFTKPLIKTAEKYGAPSDKVIMPTEGMIAQMQAEPEINYKTAFKEQKFSKSVPFVSAFREMKGSADLNKLLNRYNSGEKLSPNEVKTLNGYLLRQAEISYRGITMGGKFVQAMLEMPAYAGEFLATDGLGSLGKNVVQKTLTKGLQNATSKQLGKRFVRGSLEAGGDAVARTLIGMPHRVVANCGDRRLHEGLTISDKGDLLLNESLEKPVTSFFKAYADVFIENLSELSGAGIKIGLGAMGHQLKKALPKGTLRSLLKFARAARPNSEFSQILTKTGFNGILEEYGEERLGDLLKVATGLDDRDISTFEKITNALFPSPEQALLEFGLFGVWGGASHLSLNLANHLLERGIKKQEVEHILQNTSMLEKEKMLDDLIVRPYLQEAQDGIKKLHDDFIQNLMERGRLSKQEAVSNAELYKNRLEAVFVKYGNDFKEKNIDFNQWYKDRITVINNSKELDLFKDSDLKAIISKEYFEGKGLDRPKKTKDDDSLYDIVRQFKHKNSSIAFAKNGKTVIKLGDNTNSYTLPHELANFFLEDLRLISGFSKTAKKDLEEINKWLGYKGGDYSLMEREKFTNEFHKYILTSPAPNSGLNRTFENFKDWMKFVYMSEIGSSNNPMSDDIKISLNNLFLSDTEYMKNAEKFYKENIVLQDKINNPEFQEKVQDSIYNLFETWKLFYDRMFLPLDTRLSKISQEFTNKVKRYTFNLLCLEKKDSDNIMPFLEKAKGLNPDDFYTLDLALKNRDTRTINILLDKLNLTVEYKKVRKTLDEIFDATQDVGMDVNYMNAFYPRVLKSDKIDNFIEYMELLFYNQKPDAQAIYKKKSGFRHSKLVQEMRARNKDKVWSMEDIAKFFDNQIRGFGKDNILLSRIGQLKFERTIPVLDKNMNIFYMPFTEALPYYVSNARKTIEARKFLGSESVEVQKLRKTLKQKRTTLAEVKSRSAASAKYKELTRLNIELSALNVRYENSLAYFEQMKENLKKSSSPQVAKIRKATISKLAELQQDLDKQKEKIANLKQDIALKEELTPKEVKDMVLDRLRKDISNAGMKIQSLVSEEQSEENIGRLVTELVETKVIKADEEKIVKDILKAKFNYGNVSGVTEWIRDIGYLGTLNDITNTLTQFTDLSFSFYQNGLFDGLAGITQRKEIDIKDIGLNKAYEEFRTTSGLTKLVNGMFKIIGFEHVDAFGKNVLMNSSIKHARRLLQKNDTQMTERFKLLFGKDYKLVANDLINGNITPDVRFFAFCELTKFQPVTLDQLPEMYAKGGVYRLVYSLKTYTLKMLDVVRQDIFYQIKKNPVKAITNLAKFQLFLLLFGVPKDLIKDLISNKEFSVPDAVLDNLVIFQLLNRFTFKSVSRDGLGTALRSFVEPPVIRMLDNITNPNKSTITVKKKEPVAVTEVYAWNYLPIVGSFFYDWFGGGMTKRLQHQN